MAKIGSIDVKIAGVTPSLKESGSVKLSAHEVAIYPHTYGEIFKPYTVSRKWTLQIEETEKTNPGVYKKLFRLMKRRGSVQLDFPEIDSYSVGFLTKLEITKREKTEKSFLAVIEEGLRNYIHGCDDKTDWLSNGTLSVDTSDFKEGTGSVKCYGSMGAGEALYASAPVTMPPRLLTCSWLAFWLKTDNITDLSSAKLGLLVDSSNYAEIDVTSQVDQINEWILVRFKREDCEITGSISWNDVESWKLMKEHSSAQTHAFWMDEICALQ